MGMNCRKKLPVENIVGFFIPCFVFVGFQGVEFVYFLKGNF